MAYTQDENGNYKRTVRCGYCYEIGHNKSSCPQKKQMHKDKIAEYEQQIAEDKFTDDWERDYAKRLLSQHRAALRNLPIVASIVNVPIVAMRVTLGEPVVFARAI